MSDLMKSARSAVEQLNELPPAPRKSSEEVRYDVMMGSRVLKVSRVGNGFVAQPESNKSEIYTFVFADRQSLMKFMLDWSSYEWPKKQPEC